MYYTNKNKLHFPHHFIPIHNCAESTIFLAEPNLPPFSIARGLFFLPPCPIPFSIARSLLFPLPSSPPVGMTLLTTFSPPFILPFFLSRLSIAAPPRNHSPVPTRRPAPCEMYLLSTFILRFLLSPILVPCLPPRPLP